MEEEEQDEEVEGDGENSISSREGSNQEGEEDDTWRQVVTIATTKNVLIDEHAAKVVVNASEDATLASFAACVLAKCMESHVAARLAGEGVALRVAEMQACKLILYELKDTSGPKAKKKKLGITPIDDDHHFRQVYCSNDDSIEFGVVLAKTSGGDGLASGTSSSGAPSSDIETSEMHKEIAVVVCHFTRSRALSATKETFHFHSQTDGNMTTIPALLRSVSQILNKTKRFLTSGEVVAFRNFKEDGSAVRSAEFALTSNYDDITWKKKKEPGVEVTRVGALVCRSNRDPKWVPGDGENAHDEPNDDEVMARLCSYARNHMLENNYMEDEQTIRLMAHKIFTQKPLLQRTMEAEKIVSVPQLPSIRQLRPLNHPREGEASACSQHGGGGERSGAGQPDFGEMKEMIMMKIMSDFCGNTTAGHAQRSVVSPEPSQTPLQQKKPELTPHERLEQLKELLEDDLITQDEYEVAKKDVLSLLCRG